MSEPRPAIIVPVLGEETQVIVTPAVSLGSGSGATNAIISDVTGIPGASIITNCVAISQVDYDAIDIPDPTTLYVII